MASSVDALQNLLEQANLEQENAISIKGQGLKLNSKEDASELIAMINKLSDLQTLELTGNTIGVDAAKAISECIRKRPELEKCLWADMFTGRLRAEIPISLDHLGKALIAANSHIVELDLSDNAFGPDCAKACVEFLQSPSAYSLKYLKFNNNGLGGGGVILANALLECHKRSCAAGTPLALKLFIAGRNRLENPGAKALSRAFKTIGTLEEIHMPQNGIQHEGIAAMADCVRHSPNLRHINLNDNTFTEKGAVAMADAIKNINSLEVINFGDCLIRTEGAAALGRALKDSNGNLKKLILAFGEVKLEGGLAVCEAMKNKEHLEEVDLNGNEFGEEGCDEVRQLAEQFARGADVLVDLDDDEGSGDDDEDDDESGADDDSEPEEDQEDETGAEYNDGLNASNLLTSLDAVMLARLKQERVVKLMRDFVEVGADAQATANAFMKLTGLLPVDCLDSSGAGTPSSAATKNKILACYDVLLKDALDKYPNTPMLVVNPLFVAMGLIKGEEKRKIVQPLTDVRANALAIGHICKQSYFPAHLRKTVRSLIAKDNGIWEKHPDCRSRLMQQFYTF